MIKAYQVRDGSKSVTSTIPVVASVVAVNLVTQPGVWVTDEDSLVMQNTPEQCARLGNSEMLASLPSHLADLSDQQSPDIKLLISESY